MNPPVKIYVPPSLEENTENLFLTRQRIISVMVDFLVSDMTILRQKTVKYLDVNLDTTF